MIWFSFMHSVFWNLSLLMSYDWNWNCHNYHPNLFLMRVKINNCNYNQQSLDYWIVKFLPLESRFDQSWVNLSRLQWMTEPKYFNSNTSAKRQLSFILSFSKTISQFNGMCHLKDIVPRWQIHLCVSCDAMV